MDTIQDIFTKADHDYSKNTTKSEATYTSNQVQEIIQHELAAFITHEMDKENKLPLANESTNALSEEEQISALIENEVKQHPPTPCNHNNCTPKALKT